MKVHIEPKEEDEEPEKPLQRPKKGRPRKSNTTEEVVKIDDKKDDKKEEEITEEIPKEVKPKESKRSKTKEKKSLDKIEDTADEIIIGYFESKLTKCTTVCSQQANEIVVYPLIFSLYFLQTF